MHPAPIHQTPLAIRQACDCIHLWLCSKAFHLRRLSSTARSMGLASVRTAHQLRNSGMATTSKNPTCTCSPTLLSLKPHTHACYDKLCLLGEDRAHAACIHPQSLGSRLVCQCCNCVSIPSHHRRESSLSTYTSTAKTACTYNV